MTNDRSSAWPPNVSDTLALARVTARLKDVSTDIAALFERACLLDRLGAAEAARQAYLDVLAQDFGHAGAFANLGTRLFADGFTSAAKTVFAQAVAARPDDPVARVNLANLLREAGGAHEARAEYEAALRQDPACCEAHQGLSYLLDGVDDAAASHHRALGFADRSLTTAPYRGRTAPIVVVRLVSARGGNIPTRHILDDRLFLVHTLVAEFAGVAVLPPHQVIFNTIGDADCCGEALAAALRLVADVTVPVLNSPDKILPTTRAESARRLAGLPGVIAPRTELLSHRALAEGLPAFLQSPFLLRSPGYHTGQHFCRVGDAAGLADALAALPGEDVFAIEFLNAAGPDGAYRKYRVMFIGPEILPLHLAISASWKVHYYTANMAENAEHRAEEARFLQDMPVVVGPVAMAALHAIKATLGLDYGGIDFAVAPDGRLLLFEANATMTISPPAGDPMWEYRRPATRRALAAAQDLVCEAAMAWSRS